MLGQQSNLLFGTSNVLQNAGLQLRFRSKMVNNIAHQHRFGRIRRGSLLLGKLARRRWQTVQLRWPRNLDTG